MSKKRKRKNRQLAQSPQQTSAGSEISVKKLPDNFNPDYSYVMQDLRNIGILAGIFITLLIILSLFL